MYSSGHLAGCHYRLRCQSLLLLTAMAVLLATRATAPRYPHSRHLHSLFQLENLEDDRQAQGGEALTCAAPPPSAQIVLLTRRLPRAMLQAPHPPQLELTGFHPNRPPPA